MERSPRAAWHKKGPRRPEAGLTWSRPSAAFPTLVFRPRPDYVVAVRLTEIRFEGLVGLTPPLSCALPLRTGHLFDCGTGCGDYSTARMSF